MGHHAGRGREVGEATDLVGDTVRGEGERERERERERESNLPPELPLACEYVCFECQFY